MPWKVPAVSDVRFALCHTIRSSHLSVAQAARDFGVSRKTANKWLALFDSNNSPAGAVAADLLDRSRRPCRSPGKTSDATEAAALALRDQYNWGPRKIRAVLLGDGHANVPSVRTIAAVLKRNGRVCPPALPVPPSQRFERPNPNDLWQLDFKGAIEVGHRQKLMPFTVLDDHSRYLLSFKPCSDVTMATAWGVLWDVFGNVGLPLQILCDNAFATMGTACPAGVSWFESQLIRLDIGCAHGRPYHPQTQGKVERLHGSAMRELIHFNARRDSAQHFRDDCDRWRNTYNTRRPHEALSDLPPAARYRPSPRPRPRLLPEPLYPDGSVLRTVSDSGHITVDSYRILCGRGIHGHKVRIEQLHKTIDVFYCRKRIRHLAHDQLRHGIVL